MLAFGMMELAANEMPVYVAALSDVSGIGHILLGAGLVWMLLTLLRHETERATA